MQKFQKFKILKLTVNKAIYYVIFCLAPDGYQLATHRLTHAAGTLPSLQLIDKHVARAGVRCAARTCVNIDADKGAIRMF